MKTLIFAVCALLSLPLFSQDTKDQEKELSKMETFAAKSGMIIKFEDYKMPDIALSFSGKAQIKIRKITAGSEIAYFLQISNEGKYGTKTASIAEEDIKDIQEALNALRESEIKDKFAGLDYIENGFLTEDYFKVGYYVTGKKSNWYMQLERFGSGNTIFLNQQVKPESIFRDAINKINELKE